MKSLRYAVELSLSMVAYFALIFVSNAVDRHTALSPVPRVAVALLPMIGAIGALIAIMRRILTFDEMQRRLQFEGLVFAFAASAMLTFGWAFGETAGLPKLPTFAIWPIMAALWVVGLVLAKRRYA